MQSGGVSHQRSAEAPELSHSLSEERLAACWLPGIFMRHFLWIERSFG